MSFIAPLQRGVLPLALVLVGCIVAVAWAEDVKPYPLDTCIVAGDKIDPAIPPVVYKGQQVKFCCKGCVKKFNANPDKYMTKLAQFPKKPEKNEKNER
jgi:hypothetical protein